MSAVYVGGYFCAMATTLIVPNGTAVEQLCTTVYFPVLAIT